MKKPFWLLVALCMWVTVPAAAHKPSDSYLTLRVDGADLEGKWDIALRDLDRALTLDADGNGELTAGELRTHEDELTSYALERLTLRRRGTPCALESGPLTLAQHSDGPYARLPIHAHCQSADARIELGYGFFFELDPQHRSVVSIRTASAEATERTFVITTHQRTLSFELERTDMLGESVALVRTGIEHILSGLDHVLFLIALLLPAMLGRTRTSTDASSRPLSEVVRDVVKVVTAFTVAHSITLGLAALGVVSMSARIIEPAIAASVALAAADNLWPIFGGTRWSIAFALGLLHGFGFASALSDLGLAGGALLRGLLCFNVGVELGQLFLVALFVPLALLLRSTRFYRFAVLRGGSLSIVALSLVWLFERVRGE